MIKFEDVEKLADLQAVIKEVESRADMASSDVGYAIDWLTGELARLKEERVTARAPYMESIEGLNIDIGKLKVKIVDDWDGEKKTIEYESGTLRLITRKKLVISNESAMMADVIRHIEPERVVDYIEKFDPKKITEYMGTFLQPPEVAEVVSTTTASFKNK